MKTKTIFKKIILLFVITTIFSCSSDDDSTSDNTAPVIEAQSFTVSENITSDTVFATVTATDPDGDNLTYSIVTNSSGLFSINNNGELSVTVGASLDFETTDNHTITVAVADISETKTATISIAVTDAEDAFITTWETTTDNEMITIPTNSGLYTYNYTINWGDGISNVNQTTDATHTYATAGTYTISILGTFPAIYFNNGGDRDKIQTIAQWGSITWESMNRAFYGCTNITLTATDVPDLTNVTDISLMFENARIFNGDLSSWNVSSVTDMTRMFIGATVFNQDLSSWDVSNVTDMEGMFRSAPAFNQDLSSWNVSNVTNMSTMFANASSFDQDISNWNVSGVIDMLGMFNKATAFNQNISSWNVNSVLNMTAMFQEATSFNQDLSNWDTSNVMSCTDFATDSALTAGNLPTLGPCF